jgi:hypothetical protein
MESHSQCEFHTFSKTVPKECQNFLTFTGESSQMARSTASSFSRPHTTSFLLCAKHGPRWEQIAAKSFIPVVTFRGLQDVPSKNTLLGLFAPQATPPPSRDPPPTLESVLSDPDCQNAANDIHHLSECDTALLPRLIEYLRLLAQDSAAKGDYPTAFDANSKRTIAVQEYRSRKPPPVESRLVGDQERLIQERRATWRQQIADFDDDTARQITDHQNRYQVELSEFNIEWETHRMERYRKPSPALIRDRQMEMEMIRRDQIDRAKFIHDGIKSLEVREYEQRNAEFERDYRDARAALVAAQNVSFQAFSKSRETDREILLKNIAKEEDVLAHRLRVLKQKPANLPPFQTQYEFKLVPTRPKIAPTESSQNPGERLPKLRMPLHLPTGGSTTPSGSHEKQSPTKNSTQPAARDTGQNRQKNGVLNDVVKDTIVQAKRPAVP